MRISSRRIGRMYGSCWGGNATIGTRRWKPSMISIVTSYGCGCEVGEEGAGGFESAAGLGRAANPLRAGADVRDSRSRASGPARGVQQDSGSVSAGQHDRAQPRKDLPIGQSSPEPETGTGNGIKSAARRLWKRRSLRELGNRKAIPTFPQPRRRQIFGYIANVSTIIAKVTFRNGLTGYGRCSPDDPG